MKVGIGADKESADIAAFLSIEIESAGHHITDFGMNAESTGDSKKLAEAVGYAVQSRQVHTAILICRTGISMTIAVNKVPGVRGLFCSGLDELNTNRLQYDANVLCIASDHRDPKMITALVNTWLKGR